jgi:hypothetical protein
MAAETSAGGRRLRIEENIFKDLFAGTFRITARQNAESRSL